MGGTLEQLIANPPSAQPGYWQQGINNLTTLKDYQARNALAQIYQDPTVVNQLTGAVDQGRLNALISQSPAASWNAGPAMQQQGQAQAAQAQGLNEQTAGHLARLKVMSGEMSDLLQSGQPITADQVHARLNSLGQEGILTTGDMNGLNADLATQPPGADLTGWLRNHMATNLSAAEQLQNVTSQPQLVDQGDRKVVVESNVNRPGGQRVGTSYVQGLDPATAGDIVLINMGDGTTQQMPRSRAQQLFGANYQSRIVPPGGSAPPVPSGRYTPPPGPQAQGGGATTGGAAATGGSATAAPPPAAATSAAAPAQPNAMGGVSVPGQAGVFKYPNGKTGGAPDATGGVQYSDGTYGTPSGGFRQPIGAGAAAGTAAAPAASATAPLPVGKDGPYVLGDSIGQGVQKTGGWAGNTLVGRSPQQVLGTIGSAPIQGRDVVLSSGAANNPAQAGLLQQQIDAANKAGAKSITVMGVADPKVNAQLQTIAQQNGARFVPLGAIGTDGIHPADYKPLAAAVVPPQQQTQTQQPQQPPPQPTLSGGPPGFGRSAPLGVPEATRVAAEGSAQDQVAFRRDLPAAQGRIFTAQQALSALADTKTGTGTIPLQTINGLINSYAPDALKAWIPGYDPNIPVNRDLAEKYMTQLTMGRASQFGPTTDARLAAAFTGSANTHIQQLAAQDVLKVGIGLDRMTQAMGDDMQTQNVAPQDFSAWRQNWVRTHDPRAFVVDSMSPEQRAYLQKSLQNASPQEREIFAQTYHQAVGGGYVPSVIPNPKAASAQAGQ
jgi:hypothetical protein